MASPLIPDEVWESLKTLLPEPPVYPAGGRPPIGDREVLTGILFVLRSGIVWEDLPSEMGCGCGMTCVRRLRQWQTAGIWPQMEHILRTRLPKASRYDWSRIGDVGQPTSGRVLRQADRTAGMASGESLAAAGD